MSSPLKQISVIIKVEDPKLVDNLEVVTKDVTLAATKAAARHLKTKLVAKSEILFEHKYRFDLNVDSERWDDDDWKYKHVKAYWHEDNYWGYAGMMTYPNGDACLHVYTIANEAILVNHNPKTLTGEQLEHAAESCKSELYMIGHSTTSQKHGR